MTRDPDEPTSPGPVEDPPASSADRGGRRWRPRRRARKQLPLWQESILLLGIALVLAVVIKALFVQAFYIPSESMEPGLVRNDRILVQKVSYWGGGSPERGDVVVFKDPGGWLNEQESAGPESLLARTMAKIGLYPSGGHLVKRVIGVAGDTVECCDAQGRLLVNGEPLDEDAYIKVDPGACDGPMVTECTDDKAKKYWKVGPIPDGELFVMGDNRSHSADSSFHLCTRQKSRVEQCDPDSHDEFVPVDNVVGKVLVVLWPADHFRWVKRPAAFDALSESLGR